MEKETQFPSRGPLRPDELSVCHKPHTGVGASYVIPLRAVERATHLYPFSNDIGNRRWFLNSTIDLNAFNLLKELFKSGKKQWDDGMALLSVLESEDMIGWLLT